MSEGGPTRSELYFDKYTEKRRKLQYKKGKENTLVYQGVFRHNEKYIELYLYIQIVGGNLVGFDDNQHIVLSLNFVFLLLQTFCL